MDHRSWHLALFCLSLCFGSGFGYTPRTNAGEWCVARPDASETALQTVLDHACGQGGADCSEIQPGGSCYIPITVRYHASYVFNENYQRNPAPSSCDFEGTATLTKIDPSSGNCIFDASSSSTSKSPPASVSPPSPETRNPTAPTTPTTLTPPGLTPPGLTPPSTMPGRPNTASSAFNSLLLLFASGLLASLLLANYI
ncbi:PLASMODESMATA CALLOSE-BINDING PROTEIN 3-like [Lotus japonicus]|uniref:PLASMODESMATA CALLOSE-BINDING PROTEIN 3-like n=1 Tax=Lotus japonicus TaxID=34305 RepID=UPI0025874EB8|nr:PLASMODESMATA CALLOSE-BINDING PROTEIN 3-like [Lotus japonicus]